MDSFATLVEWPQPVFELLGFVALFLAVGAVGFHHIVLRSRALRADAGPSGLLAHADRRAAALGLTGTLLTALLLAIDLPGTASERHTTVADLLRTSRVLELQVAMLALATLGFIIALGRSGIGWGLAAVGVIVGTLRGLINGRWERMVNPVHELAGGLWIGTLFVMVAAGLTSVLHTGFPKERRGRIAADMVNAFSPFALVSAGVLALFGVITAVRHLKYVAALWTTPYGVTFIVKLAAVLGVLALGAWNWRRQRPRLGAEDAAHSLKRSATLEVTFAAIVLVITAVLVSLPAPKRPGAGPPPVSSTGGVSGGAAAAPATRP